MSTLEFLAPVAAGADVVARSPMEALARDAGARFEVRDGFNVAISYPPASDGESVSWPTRMCIFCRRRIRWGSRPNGRRPCGRPASISASQMCSP